MRPPLEYAMRCNRCGPRFPWLRFGTTPTTCVWCGGFDVVATRVAA